MSTSPTAATPPPPPLTIYSSPPVTVILTVILLIFFFIGFFSIYFCRCFVQNLLYSWHLRQSPSGTPLGPAGANDRKGVDPSIIESFPTFTYSSVKDYRKDKYGLECAICLIEFDDEAMLRLLPLCCHVFHQECIDLWLESHKTCPVCRSSLDTPVKSPEKLLSPNNVNSMHDIQEDETLEDCHDVRITIKDDHANSVQSGGDEAKDDMEGNTEHVKVDKFSRSHSTGHSIVRKQEGSSEDRFTLRLPEDVQAEIIRGHNATRSCTTFGEFTSKTSAGNGGFAEASGLSNVDTR